MDEEHSRIRIFLDDRPDPIADYEPPVAVNLDTRSLPDGRHHLRIEARSHGGRVGVREVPFQVRNGPGITVTGIHKDAIVHGELQFSVNAFGAEDPFKPNRAESKSPIPVWCWVLSLVIVVWAVWYGAVMWEPPASFANTPTYVPNTAWQQK